MIEESFKRQNNSLAIVSAAANRLNQSLFNECEFIPEECNAAYKRQRVANNTDMNISLESLYQAENVQVVAIEMHYGRPNPA